MNNGKRDSWRGVKVSRLVGLSAALLVLAGCAASGSGSGSERTVVEGSRVKAYHSIAELKQDTDAVVVVTAASGATVGEGSAGIPYTDTTVRVQQVLGAYRSRVSAGGSLIVRQIGKPDTEMPGDIPMLTAGHHYLLFVTQLYPNRPGLYGITGAAGGFEFASDETLRRLDPESPDLPTGITEQAMRARLQQ